MEKRKQDLMAWNSGKVFNGTCYPINPIRLWNDVYTQLGYEVGTEVPQLFSDIVPTTGFDSYKLVATNGSVFYFLQGLLTPIMLWWMRLCIRPKWQMLMQ